MKIEDLVKNELDCILCNIKLKYLTNGYSLRLLKENSFLIKYLNNIELIKIMNNLDKEEVYIFKNLIEYSFWLLIVDFIFPKLNTDTVFIKTNKILFKYDKIFKFFSITDFNFSDLTKEKEDLFQEYKSILFKEENIQNFIYCEKIDAEIIQFSNLIFYGLYYNLFSKRELEIMHKNNLINKFISLTKENNNIYNLKYSNRL